MSTTETESSPLAVPQEDERFYEALFQSVSSDLGMIIDQELAIEDVRVTRETARPAGMGGVHISFRVELTLGEATYHGCVLAPLPDAITLASFLMMVPEEEIEERRGLDDLDASLKDAMLEVGNFVAGAVDAVVRDWFDEGTTSRAAGCQGVRADVRPAFTYEEGDVLVVGRAKAELPGYEPFELIAMLPAPPASV